MSYSFVLLPVPPFPGCDILTLDHKCFSMDTVLAAAQQKSIVRWENIKTHQSPHWAVCGVAAPDLHQKTQAQHWFKWAVLAYIFSGFLVREWKISWFEIKEK